MPKRTMEQHQQPVQGKLGTKAENRANSEPLLCPIHIRKRTALTHREGRFG